MVHELPLRITGNDFSFERAVKFQSIHKVATDFILVAEEFGPLLDAAIRVRVFCVREQNAVPINARYIGSISSTSILYHWYAADPKDMENFSG